MSAELERLATLRNQGVLTDEEFAAAKAKLLGL
jgi:Short C-terminal domain